MNLKDRSGESKNDHAGDKLDKIFSGQKALMPKYKEIAEEHYAKIFKQKVHFSAEAWSGSSSNLHTKEGNYLIRDMLNAAAQEIGETIQVMKNWKAWKATEMPTDVTHFKEEFVDILHFLIEAAILAGITPDELFDLYFKKNEVNHFRQDSKY